MLCARVLCSSLQFALCRLSSLQSREEDIRRREAELVQREDALSIRQAHPLVTHGSMAGMASSSCNSLQLMLRWEGLLSKACIKIIMCVALSKILGT